jgi:hypothetical protein
VSDDAPGRVDAAAIMPTARRSCWLTTLEIE